MIGATIFLAACSNPKTDKAANPAVDKTSSAKANKAKLSEMAVTACECDLAQGTNENKKCWAAYRTATESFRPKNQPEIGTTATACAPVSTIFDELRDSTGEFSVIVGYSVNGVDIPNRNLCRKEEAKAIEDAFSEAMKKASPVQDSNIREAQAAAKKALAAVRAGKTPNAKQSSGGCV